MKYLVIDGNSIINRAFYGIKLLNAKDGHFTNAIYGFMNILLNLTEKYSPDAVIAAFDVHKPTFRHLMYSDYKAGRKGAPPELIEQFEPLKTLLSAYGCSIVECEGYEADDILGTLSVSIGAEDHCYIATGDRDSLQLIKKNVSVLLTTTKMGKTQTVEYDEKLLFEEYGVAPSGMIELKALQGDSSDNIPGVAGIGPKTAGELIKKYRTIENIYADLSSVEASKGVIAKLDAGKESAFFSKKLGTISLEAPINTDMSSYLGNKRDESLLLNELVRHEMFKMITRLGLENVKQETLHCGDAENGVKSATVLSIISCDEAVNLCKASDKVGFYVSLADKEINHVALVIPDKIVVVENNCLEFNSFIKTVAEDANIAKITYDCKSLYHYCIANDISLRMGAYFHSTLTKRGNPNEF